MFFFVLQFIRKILVLGDVGGDTGDTEMPSIKVGIELEVHIELVPSGIVEVAHL